MTITPTVGPVSVALPGIIYGGMDYPIQLTFAVGELAVGDLFHIDWRTSFEGNEVGITSSGDEGDVILDVPNNRATLIVRHAKTAKWFAAEIKASTIDANNRVVDLIGTYVHTDSQGRTKGASGLIEFSVKFRIGNTRD